MKTDIASKELELNIRHQNLNINEFTVIGYEFEQGRYVFVLMLPHKQFPMLKPKKLIKELKKEIKKLRWKKNKGKAKQIANAYAGGLGANWFAKSHNEDLDKLNEILDEALE